MKENKLQEGLVVDFTDKGIGVTEEGVLLRGTLPGEKVAFLPQKKQRGRLQEVITKSPHRIEPVCRHFGVCGGCSFQHLPYSEELKWKERQFTTSLPILPAKAEWHTRNRMDFTFSQDQSGKRFLGLFQDRGRVLDVQECYLCPTWFIAVINEVRAWWEEENVTAYIPHKDVGLLRTLIVREGKFTEEKQVILHVSSHPETALKKEQITSFVQKMQALLGEDVSLFLLIQQSIKGSTTQFYEMHLSGKPYLVEQLGDLSFQISPQAFFQTNSAQALVLYQTACTLLNLEGNETVLDLFCGTGTLSLFLSQKAKQVIGIELSKEAVLDAQENQKRNGITNVSFLQGDVAELLPTCPKADIVVIDPPRVGLSVQAVQALLATEAKSVLYISCNPKTLARDLDVLSSHYTVEKMQPLDQFPKTYHIEAMVILRRK